MATFPGKKEGGIEPGECVDARTAWEYVVWMGKKRKKKE